MRKVFSLIVLLVLLSGLWLLRPAPGHAQALATPTPAFALSADFVSFSMLGETDTVLRGPFDSMFLRFSAPATWKFEPGAVLRLVVDSSAISSIDIAPLLGVSTGASMEVTLNEQYLGAVFLTEGERIYEFPVPDFALAYTRIDGRHELEILLNAAIDCELDHQTMVLLKSSSGFSLPHQPKLPTLDLAQLPSPIYQMDTFLVEPAVIVVPDRPSMQELQSALTVSAAFGRISQGMQTMSLVTASNLTDAVTASSHLIFVGKPGGLPPLRLVDLPAPVVGATVTARGAQPQDGVIQIAISPWNPARAALYLGGNEDDGVVKAAQAFSSGALRAGLSKNLTVITNIADAIEITYVEADRTLAGLGYLTQTMAGAGYQSLLYNFLMPTGQMPGADPYFDLIYSHSALMDFDLSGVIVLLNNQTIGSVRFNEETANSVSSIRINLPAFALRQGNNTLEIQAEFVPTDYCSLLNREGLWMTVYDNSLVHIPLVSVENKPTVQVRDLTQYPAPFYDSPSLANTGFVLPVNDSLSWDIAAKIAGNIGRRATGNLITLDASFADNVSDEFLVNHDLIVVGRASQLPIITEMSDAPPAPFIPGSDIAQEKGAQVSYLIPEGTNLGYLELFPSPWDTSRTVLAVLGSTPTGLQWAGNALVDATLARQLRGNLAVINDRQVFSVDTQAGGQLTMNLAATASPGSYSTLIPEPLATTSSPYRPGWMLVAIIIVSVLIVVIAVILLIGARRQSGRNIDQSPPTD